MENDFVEDVYDTLCGYLIEEAQVSGVESVFEEGMLCEKLYGDVRKAYERLCTRLGVQDEDGDVEIIIDSLLSISRELGLHMYRYGTKFADQQ